PPPGHRADVRPDPRSQRRRRPRPVRAGGARRRGAVAGTGGPAVTPNGARPGPVREWATFPDPGDPHRRWLVDVTWLTSPWRCLFGCGCQGVLTGPTPEMEQGCCSYGAHFTDEGDRDRVLAAAADLRADEWQHFAAGRRRGVTARLPRSGWRTRL